MSEKKDNKLERQRKQEAEIISVSRERRSQEDAAFRK